MEDKLDVIIRLLGEINDKLANVSTVAIQPSIDNKTTKRLTKKQKLNTEALASIERFHQRRKNRAKRMFADELKELERLESLKKT